MRKALSAPARQIAINAGEDGSVIVGKILEKDQYAYGFDSQNGTYQPVPIGSVTSAMSKAVSDGYWVEGMTNVGAYWQGQKAISASATTSARSSGATARAPRLRQRQ